MFTFSILLIHIISVCDDFPFCFLLVSMFGIDGIVLGRGGGTERETESTYTFLNIGTNLGSHSKANRKFLSLKNLELIIKPSSALTN